MKTIFFALGKALIRVDQIVAVELLGEKEARIFTTVGAFDVPIESEEDLRLGLQRAFAPE